MTPSPDQLTPALMNELLQFGVRTMEEVNPIFVDRYNKRDFTSEMKEDATFVTEIDKLLEKLIRDRVYSTYPEHGVLGGGIL